VQGPFNIISLPVAPKFQVFSKINGKKLEGQLADNISFNLTVAGGIY